jgi:hypothetical protein
MAFRDLSWGDPGIKGRRYPWGLAAWLRFGGRKPGKQSPGLLMAAPAGLRGRAGPVKKRPQVVAGVDVGPGRQEVDPETQLPGQAQGVREDRAAGPGRPLEQEGLRS